MVSEGENTGEAKRWIDVAFEHVESKVIGAAKGPDGQYKKNRDSQSGMFEE